MMRTSLLLLGGVSVVGCSALDVNSPTTLQRENLENAVGVELALSGVRQQVFQAYEGAITTIAIFTDESGVGTDLQELNARKRAEYLTSLAQSRNSPYDLYYRWQIAYNETNVAIPFVQRAAPAGVRGARLGEVFALRGFTLLSLAEQICPGFPIADADITDNGAVVTPRYTSDPQTTDSAFNRAIVDFDSAVAYAGDSARVLNLARIGKARALLGLGRFAEAAVLSAQVPTEFSYDMRIPSTQFVFENGYYAGDHEGTNGLDFVSANDPRVVVDTSPYCTTCYRPVKYLESSNPTLVLANGTEARLIEAEAQLAAAPEAGTWLTTLNTLRGTVGLADTADPGVQSARVDLLFRERAFWLHYTAHRLGDFRRLMAYYGRDPETLFPIGPVLAIGPQYGTLTNIPFDGEFEHKFNPKITGCTDAN